MPISHFIKDDVRSAEINRLNSAYLKALEKLDLVDCNDPIREIVAKKVVDLSSSGVVDPQVITDAVVWHFLSQEVG